MKIKRCPFCGGYPLITEGWDKLGPFYSMRVNYTRITCETCGAGTRKYYRQETVPQEIVEDDPHTLFVINLWNMREREEEPL